MKLSAPNVINTLLEHALKVYWKQNSPRVSQSGHVPSESCNIVIELLLYNGVGLLPLLRCLDLYKWVGKGS